jgi:phosphatidyl-myo-inositol dimannoside synthase
MPGGGASKRAGWPVAARTWRDERGVTSMADVDSRRRWWFITRKYPPAIGGMERLSWEVTSRLAKRHPVHVVALRASRRALPWFMIASAVRLLAGCIGRRVALVHLGDPVLAPLASIARAFGIPTVVTIHGLDVAYANPIYQRYRRMFLRDFDAYVCISDAARAAAMQAGLASSRIRVIGIGIDAPTRANDGVSRVDDRLLFIGRLVRRKGLAWFVRNVLPRVASARPSLRLAILGDGPERGAIAAAAEAAGVVNHLVWLGAADDTTKIGELARATMCVMPNVPVEGDVEGFGIVALEAAAAGCPLLASRLEGLCDAVDDGVSGRLVAPGDADAWVKSVEQWLSDPAARAAAGEGARTHGLVRRDWETIIDAYERLLVQVAETSPAPPQ